MRLAFNDDQRALRDSLMRLSFARMQTRFLSRTRTAELRRAAQSFRDGLAVVWKAGRDLVEWLKVIVTMGGRMDEIAEQNVAAQVNPVADRKAKGLDQRPVGSVVRTSVSREKDFAMLAWRDWQEKKANLREADRSGKTGAEYRDEAMLALMKNDALRAQMLADDSGEFSAFWKETAGWAQAQIDQKRLEETAHPNGE